MKILISTLLLLDIIIQQLSFVTIKGSRLVHNQKKVQKTQEKYKK